MSNDENNFEVNGNHPVPLDPELEARIVAWVAGEASPFEAAELERLVAEKPEAAAFKREMESVSGLISVAVAADAEPLLLSPERRAKVLAAIGVPADVLSLKERIAQLPKIPSAWSWRRPRFYYAISAAAAACLAVLLTLSYRTEPIYGARATLQFEKPDTVVNINAVNDSSVHSDVDLNTRIKQLEVMAGPNNELSRLTREKNKEVIAQAWKAAKAGEEAKRPVSTARAKGVPEPAFDAITLNAPNGSIPDSRYISFGAGGRPVSAGGSVTLGSGASVVGGAAGSAGTRTFSSMPQGRGYTGNGIEKGRTAPAGLASPVPAAAPSPLPQKAPTDEVVQLSPFTVSADREGNAMAAVTAAPLSSVTRSLKELNGSSANMNAPAQDFVITGGAVFGSPPASRPHAVTDAQLQSTFGQTVHLSASGSVSGVDADDARRDVAKQLSDERNIAALEQELEQLKSGDSDKKKPVAATPRLAQARSERPQAAKIQAEEAKAKAMQAAPSVAPPASTSPIKLDAFTVSGRVAGGELQPRKDVVDDALRDANLALQKDAIASAKRPDLRVVNLESMSVRGDLIDTGVGGVAGTPKVTETATLNLRLSSSTETAKETDASLEAVSTFSLHVSDVSFRLAQAALAKGERPADAKIRPEEFYNAFDYGDPAPSTAEKIGCRIEQAAHPFLQQRNLVRLAMKVAATGRGAGQPLHLTVLLDTSGSMEREDRVEAVRRAMAVLVSLLGPNDRLTLIGFARQPRLLAANVAGDHAHALLDIVARTPAEGGTNIEEALKLGREMALRYHDATAQNRIVVLTDGAANLGDAQPARLMDLVEAMRQQGIAFDACGVGLEGVGDTILEALTRKGNGRYYVLDSAETADAAFARQLAGAFRPAAENVKLQVRFNPARVGRYRLIGFEEHRLREEDFRNDQVDAAELAAEEAANALYQVEVKPEGSGEIGEVFVRFRDAASGQMVERSWTIPFDPQAPAFDRATSSMQLAGVAALMAEKLQGSPLAENFKLRDLAPVVSTLRTQYQNEPRVQELVTMFNQLRRISGE